MLARFGDYDATVDVAASAQSRELTEQREQARQALREVAEARRLAADEDVSAQEVAARVQAVSEAQATLTRVGEVLGLQALDDAMAHRYPASTFVVEGLQDGATRGPGVFDGVFRVTPIDGSGPPFVVVAEAKGPFGHLGDRRGESPRVCWRLG